MPHVMRSAVTYNPPYWEMSSENPMNTPFLRPEVAGSHEPSGNGRDSTLATLRASPPLSSSQSRQACLDMAQVSGSTAPLLGQRRRLGSGRLVGTVADAYLPEPLPQSVILDLLEEGVHEGDTI